MDRERERERERERKRRNGKIRLTTCNGEKEQRIEGKENEVVGIVRARGRDGERWGGDMLCNTVLV